MRKSKSAISFSFFFLSRRSLRDFYYPKQKKNSIERLFFGWSKVKKKKLERRRKKHTTKNEYTLVIIHTHTTSTIMFAATQQIASVAGLKATKVQVRAPRSFLCVPALAFENAVSLSLSLLCPRRNAARDIRILDFAYHFFEIRKKIASRAMCIAWRFDGSNVHRSSSRRTKTRTSSSSRAIVLCADERTPSGRDRSSGKHTTRSMRESSAFGRRRSSLESFFDFLLFFSKTSKFLYF